MLNGILKEIIEYKLDFVANSKKNLPLSEIETLAREADPAMDFRKALSRSGCSLIAEIKEASPSRGRFLADFDDETIADIYEKNGASAISVVTDEKFFMGSLQRLTRLREISNLPLLRKDFIIDTYQILESRYAGADAVLIIAACLYDTEISEYCSISSELGMAALVEVHNREEMDRIALLGIDLIGINNRNLETFETDISKTGELASHAPKKSLLVSESGIFTAGDVREVHEMGARAVLVGEALVTSKDIAAKVRELAYAVEENMKEKVQHTNHQGEKNE